MRVLDPARPGSNQRQNWLDDRFTEGSGGSVGSGEARMHALLCAQAPQLADAFAAHLPRARGMTTRRLLAAAWREDLAGLRTGGRVVVDPTTDPETDPTLAGVLAGARPGAWAVCGLPGTGTLAFPVLAEHGFGRVAVGHPVLHLCDGPARPVDHPGDLVALLAGTRTGPGWDRLAAELADSATNLALALARADHLDRVTRRSAAALGAADTLEFAGLLGATDPVFDPTLFLEKLSTGGHNLHPCARTRTGMGPADLLRYDLESTEPTVLTLVGLRRDRVDSTPDPHGRDVGELLLDTYPGLASAVAEAGVDRQEYLFLPVHDWQLNQVVRVRYAEQVACGDLVPVPAARLLAEPTAALRTLLTRPAPGGRRFHVKTALDVQVTSTRRTISAQTATNGPVFSALLDRVVADDPALSARVVLVPELAGASYQGDRSLSALVRADLTERLRPGEVAVPGCALYAGSPLGGGRRRGVLAELVDRYAAHREESRPELAALLFLGEYASVFLGATLRLMTGYGIGLEAHLQNTIPIFLDGVPTRVAFRDWGGMRVHLPRLARRGHRPDLRPGSLTVTDDVAVLRAKVAYTALQAHLGEIVVGLARWRGVDEGACWARIHAVVDRVHAEMADHAERAGDVALARDVATDADWLTGPTLPHKALVTMRLYPDGGDRYVPVPNPLFGGGSR